MKNSTEPVWKTAPISCTCEFIEDYRVPAPDGLCNAATTHAYPAMGGGWVALCFKHSHPHVRHGWAESTDELIRRGERWG